MKLSTEKQLTFEEAMEQLGGIVERLEEADVPLEEAIAIYKQGMELSKLCHTKLTHVEKELTDILAMDSEVEQASNNEED